MKLNFDEERWQQLQEDLSVGQLCGESANKLYGVGKGALQRAASGMIGPGEPSAAEARHSLAILRKLRDAAAAAAQAFTAAADLLDQEMRRLEPAARQDRPA